MIKSGEHYGARKAILSAEISSIRRSINLLVTLRVIFFLILAAGIWGMISWPFPFLWATLTLLGAVSFMFALKKHGIQSILLNVTQKRREIVESELKALEGEFPFSFDGREYLDPNHDFTHDLDIFGPRSLFHATCRAGMRSSRAELGAQLSDTSATAQDVAEKQQRIAELASMPELREEIQALTTLASEGELEEGKLISWCESKLSNAPSEKSKILFFIVPVFQVANVMCYSFDLIGESLFTIFLLAPLVLALRRMRKTQNDYGEIDTKYKELSKLTSAINILVAIDWKSESLKSLAGELKTGGEALGQLQTILSRFDDRNNFIIALLGNMFFTWDLWCSMTLHQWHREQASSVERSLEGLFRFEAWSSVAAFNFNFKDNLHTPSPHRTGGLNARQMRHPLMAHAVCVGNNLEVGDGEINIITGANMAGKSTFLRTVGLNFVLAMNGSNVCAEEFEFTPTTLYTSMRTSDSLQDQESYFFNELKRLHILVEKLESGETPFILLDEILKGTNSKDKAEGSYKFVEKLLTFGSTALIATHDLSLCTLADKHPESISNLFFDVEIKEDDLAFDYRIREGVCSNMNATFLMRKMGITD